MHWTRCFPYAMLVLLFKFEQFVRDQLMKKLTVILFAVWIVFSSQAIGLGSNTLTISIQEQENPPKRKLEVPYRGRRKGHDRRRHRGIGHAYKHAGTSAGRGSKHFAKNVAHGKPIKGGKEFGKGMGGFGKYTGKGTARTGKKVGKTVKHAVTP